MSPVRCRVLVITVAAPALLCAQAALPPADSRPSVRASIDSLKPAAKRAPTEYRNLRFDEVWTHRSDGDWSDRLKAMPLAPHLTLSIGGQLRAREEIAQRFNFTDVGDEYGQSRTLIDADLQAGVATGLHARLFAEFRDAQSYGRALPGGTRPNDGDRSELQNLFVDVGWKRSFVRHGRQEIVSGRERLLGVPDWSNTRRGSQGTRMVLVRGAVSLEAIEFRPMIIRLSELNRPDSTTRVRVVMLGNAPGFKSSSHLVPSVWQAYHFDQRVAAASVTQRVTSGGRVQWSVGNSTPGARRYGIETEAAVQRGTAGSRAVRAWFWTTELSTQFRNLHGAPSVAIGLEVASGDASPSDDIAGAFNALYPAAHAHGGYADVFGRANARLAQVISTWDPFLRLNLRGAFYHYDRLRLSDGVYNKQNTLLRAAGTSSARHAGDELDLTASGALSRHLKVIAGYAWIEPGAFLRRSAGGARSSRWGFVGSTYTF